MINDKYIELLEPEYGTGVTAHKKNIPGPPYGSHQPVLAHVVNTIESGDVIEFGVGYYSTPLLHLICENQRRKLFSIETNESWFNKFRQYGTEWHTVLWLPTFNSIMEYLTSHKFAIAFVDCDPANFRMPIIKLIEDCADYIIVHDTEDCHTWEYNWDFTAFKHNLRFEEIMPHTSVLSNLETINPEIRKIFKDE